MTNEELAGAPHTSIVENKIGEYLSWFDGLSAPTVPAERAALIKSLESDSAIDLGAKVEQAYKSDMKKCWQDQMRLLMRDMLADVRANATTDPDYAVSIMGELVYAMRDHWPKSADDYEACCKFTRRPVGPVIRPAVCELLAFINSTDFMYAPAKRDIDSAKMPVLHPLKNTVVDHSAAAQVYMRRLRDAATTTKSGLSVACEQQLMMYIKANGWERLQQLIKDHN